MARYDYLAQWIVINKPCEVVEIKNAPREVLLDIINEQINSARDSLSAGIELEENSSGRSAGVLPYSMPIH